MSSNNLEKIAKETVAAIEDEKYTTSGKTIPIGKLIDSSVKRSTLYKPEGGISPTHLERELYNIPRVKNETPNIIVTRESSLQAAERLKDERPCLLNFASAKHPGGGFLLGAAAQEESIARSSGLYASLINHPEYYEENKRSQRNNIGLYLDYAIYSPDVPVFRNDVTGEWLEEPFLTSIVTSPAPNRHAILEDEDNKKIFSDDQEAEEMMEIDIEKTFSRRIEQVLSIMVVQGHRTIILGAWGCGIFGNDPLLVAELFKDNLRKLQFFDSVVFPIFDRKGSDTVRAFEQIFGQETDISCPSNNN
jgi:uncharacterized protein (TIGR02452 family)